MVTTSYALIAVSLALMLLGAAIWVTWSRMRALEQLGAELRKGLYERLSALDASLNAGKGNLLFEGDDASRLFKSILHMAESIPKPQLRLSEPHAHDAREVQE